MREVNEIVESYGEAGRSTRNETRNIVIHEVDVSSCRVPYFIPVSLYTAALLTGLRSRSIYLGNRCKLLCVATPLIENIVANMGIMVSVFFAQKNNAKHSDMLHKTNFRLTYSTVTYDTFVSSVYFVVGI